MAEIKQQEIGALYGLQADEVSDVSNWEQLGIVVRYLKDDQPVERFVEFVACENTTGEDICNSLLSSLENLTLLPQNCRAQTYDGAGNMSGKQKGCAARFQQKSPRALYLHCASHELNLALSKACALPEIHCMLSAVQSVGIFFKYSPKRSRQLEESIKVVNEGRESSEQISISKVKLLCETRWVERHVSIEEFDDLYEALLVCLEEISFKHLNSRWDGKSVVEANGLLTQISKPNFIAAFKCSLFFFGFTKSLSSLLQGSSMDVVTAYESIEDVKKELSTIRTNADSEFSELFADMKKMATLAGQQDDELMRIPRRCGRQTLRNNIEADEPEQYWKRSVFLPYLDNLMEALDARFNQLSLQAIRGLCLIPANLGKLSDERKTDLKSYYSDDLPSLKSFEQELRLWKLSWIDVATKPDSLVSTLAEMNPKRFPNISSIFRLMLLQPATSASVERANSALKRIKTDLRSTMKEDRLNALLLLHVHRDIKLDYDKIVKKYASRHTRRMLFLNPLCGLKK